MTITVLLLSFLWIDLTTGQIPNPDQYRFTLTTDGIAQERYVIDKQAGKMSRLWFSNVGDEEFGGNQDIYIRDDGRTYLFNFMSKPPQCIANRGGPYNEMNYWPNLVQSFGGEQKIYDELIFDNDCDGTCLTWKTVFNDTYHHYHYVSRLYVKKAEQKPIKMVMNRYDPDTENWCQHLLQDLPIGRLAKYLIMNMIIQWTWKHVINHNFYCFFFKRKK